MNNTTSPKSSLAKLGLHSKSHKSIKVMVLGQSGVGKTALIVRFITFRFIGEYESLNTDRIYTHNSMLFNDLMQFEILDTAAQSQEMDTGSLESNIRWADAFIIMYSVTDKCSFDECNRLKFLINFSKKRRKLTSKDCMADVPVILVGNKTDQVGDRMVTTEEGHRRFQDLSCTSFHEISVRESVKQVKDVFEDIFHFWCVYNKCSKLKRSRSDVQPASNPVLSPDNNVNSSYDAAALATETRKSIFMIVMPLGSKDSVCLEENDETESTEDNCSSNGGDTADAMMLNGMDTPFRNRASTDGTLLSRPRRWRYPPPGCLLPHTNRVERRMSISSRGSNASC